MTFKFKRKLFLLSEKNKNSKVIGYARATHNEFKHLEEQIKKLKTDNTLYNLVSSKSVLISILKITF